MRTFSFLKSKSRSSRIDVKPATDKLFKKPLIHHPPNLRRKNSHGSQSDFGENIARERGPEEDTFSSLSVEMKSDSSYRPTLSSW